MAADLVWSDGLLDEARRARDEVGRTLTAIGVAGELVLTGATSVPGALTKGDVDLHLRVGPAVFEDAVARLRQVYELASPHAWAARFTTTWRALRDRPDLLDAYNALKTETGGTDRYEEAKSAFFTSVSEPVGRSHRPSS